MKSYGCEEDAKWERHSVLHVPPKRPFNYTENLVLTDLLLTKRES